MAPQPGNPEHDLREHLRIGARMLEALELQLTRAEETIRREEDARHRAESATSRLESIETRVLELLDRMESALGDSHADTDAQAVARSGSLQVSISNPASAPLNPTAMEQLQQAGAEHLAKALHRLAEELVAATETPTTTATSGGLTITHSVDEQPSSPPPS
ncbi:MAG: hypothetical protein MK085_07810 [Phycisphaerales bacterium]|nr:hypothetical protein [Phycisphaerales bacterium]